MLRQRATCPLEKAIYYHHDDDVERVEYYIIDFFFFLDVFSDVGQDLEV